MPECAFCSQEAKLTGEHVWSKWICELLDHSGYNFRYRNTETGEIKHWRSPTLDQTTNVVCKPCNEGWMSDIESAARATLSNIILHGAPVTLLPRGIVSLATFAFKCAVVANQMSPSPDGKPFFSPLVRHRFRNSLQIPVGVQMWLASFRGTYASNGMFTAYYAVPPIGSAGDDFDFYVFTYMAGYLVFQLVAARWNKLLRMGEPLPAYDPDPAWNPATLQFWPNQYGFPVTWPPSQHFSDDSIDAFRDRLRGTIRVRIY